MQRPSNAWREQPYWHWDWPGRPVQQLNGGPSASGQDADYVPPPLKAVLYLPDPQSRTGWQLHHVTGDTPKPAPPRKLGYY